MTLNTQIRISPKKLAVLYQLFANRIPGRVTTARLINEAVTQVFGAAKKGKSQIQFFEDEASAVSFLISNGIASSQFSAFEKEKKRTSTDLNLSEAISEALKEIKHEE